MLTALLALALLTAPGRFSTVTLQAPGPVTLAWDANPAADNVTSYTVLYGTASGTYSTLTPAGNVTQWTTPTLAAGTYYFAVTATDADGLSSQPSAEVSTLVPVPTQDPSCVPPLGANAVSIFITQLENTTGSVGSKARLDYQLGSPGSPVLSVAILVNGVQTKQFGPAGSTDLTADGGMWFTTPSVAGTYPVTLTVTNAQGCSATQTKDALGNPLTVTVK